MTEMHDVVEMLLNRMRDYPEDFVDMDYHTHVAHRANENKWTKAFGLAKSGATKEEGLALEAAYQAAKRAIYMGAALKTMLSDDEPEEQTNMKQYKHQSLGLNITAPTITTTNTSMIADLEARIKAQEVQMQRQYALNTYAGNAAGSALG